jgi:hypothetical protein
MKRLVIIAIALLLFLPLFLSGQKSNSKNAEKITLSGLIISPDKNPVPAAKIYIDSLFTGKMSDNSGRYRIKVSGTAKRIIVSSPEWGYCAEDINGRREIDLTLNGDGYNMNTFMALNVKKYKPEKPVKVKKMNTYTDIYQMIRQEVPGVLVSGRSIVVQQQNSFFGSTTPLFVVNGVRVNSIDYINPLEVKSIQLLKGSNANIYGTEGANGVISITLISGKDN